MSNVPLEIYTWNTYELETCESIIDSVILYYYVASSRFSYVTFCSFKLPHRSDLLLTNPCIIGF